MNENTAIELKFSDQSCQTDEDLIYNYAWTSKIKYSNLSLSSFF